MFYFDDRVKTHNSSINGLEMVLNEESVSKIKEDSLETQVKNFVEKKK